LDLADNFGIELPDTIQIVLVCQVWAPLPKVDRKIDKSPHLFGLAEDGIKPLGLGESTTTRP